MRGESPDRLPVRVGSRFAGLPGDGRHTYWIAAVTRLNVCVFIFSLLFTASISVAEDKRSVDLLPSNAVLAASLAIKENDPGQKWAFGELTKYLISEAGEREKAAPLDEIRLFRFSDFCFSLFPSAAGGRRQMLISAGLLPSGGTFGLTYGDQKFQLNVRDAKTANNTQTSLLTLFLGIACKVPANSPPEGGIYLNPLRAEKGKFSAFSVSDERAVVATDKALIQAALSNGNRLTASRPYREIMALLPTGWDAYCYADNGNAALSSMLEAKNRGWQTLLLALLSPAKRAGMALDVVDKDHSLIVLVLAASGPQEAKELRRKLEPTLALLVSQYLDKRIASAIKFEELPNALRIDARLSNTSSYWEAVFKKKAAAPTPRPITEKQNEPTGK